MTFLAPTWLGLCLMTTLIAGSSIVGDRRRGFFELVLATPLTPREIIDGTCLAVWEHVRRLYWLPWVLCLLFCLARASTLIGVCCSLITGTLFLALAVMQGVACSLSARTLAGALVAAFLLPVAAIVGTGMLIGIFEWGNGPALWILCLIGLPVTWFWVRRRLNPASVGCFLTTAHLSLAALFSCWTASRGQHELPIAAMHPGYIVMVTLSDPREYWFGGNHLHWFPVLFWYWSALVLNLAWLRWWLIRHFDRFVERPKQTLGGARPRAAKAPVASLAKST